MKKILLFFLTGSAILFSSDLGWQKDFEGAFDVAEKRNQLVMVMVGRKHCRWCKKMRYRTLENTRVKEKLKEFVIVKTDLSDYQTIQKLPPIDGVPTIFFFYPDKKLLETVRGYYDVNDFLSFLTDIDRKVWKIR